MLSTVRRPDSGTSIDTRPRIVAVQTATVGWQSQKTRPVELSFWCVMRDGVRLTGADKKWRTASTAQPATACSSAGSRPRGGIAATFGCLPRSIVRHVPTARAALVLVPLVGAL
jgi:hypothetical protein